MTVCLLRNIFLGWQTINIWNSILNSSCNTLIERGVEDFSPYFIAHLEERWGINVNSFYKGSSILREGIKKIFIFKHVSLSVVCNELVAWETEIRLRRHNCFNITKGAKIWGSKRNQGRESDVSGAGDSKSEEEKDRQIFKGARNSPDEDVAILARSHASQSLLKSCSANAIVIVIVN